MSMDNLRDRIRANQSDTQELNELPPHFEQLKDRQETSDLPTTAELSESILANAQNDEDVSFADAQDKMEEPDIQDKKKLFKLPFIEKLDQLEINKKMLGISLALAGLATVLTGYYISVVTDPYEKIPVVVVTKDVPANTKLTSNMLAVEYVPKEYVPQGALRYTKGLKVSGQTNLTKLYQGEVLFKERVSLKTGISIPKGHRAVLMQTRNAYQMKPGDFVDVIASVQDPNPTQRGKIISIPVLQKAEVLAVGQQYNAEVEYKNYNPKEITIAVPNKKVNLMNLLEEKGNFKVVLRSAEDDSTINVAYTPDEIEAALQGEFSPKTVSMPPKPAETPEPKEEKDPDVDDKEVDKEVKKLVDLSTPRTTYRAPARRYTPPRRTYRAPVRRAAPKPAVRRAAPKPAPVQRAPVRRSRPVVINGGKVTQGK